MTEKKTAKKKINKNKTKAKTTMQHVSLKTLVDEKSLKLPKKLSEIVNRGKTDSTMAKKKVGKKV